jgi:hypothetical protein
MRKIVQIAHSQAMHPLGLLYALCDDGTVWRLHLHNEGQWEPIQEIPSAAPSCHSADQISKPPWMS